MCFKAEACGLCRHKDTSAHIPIPSPPPYTHSGSSGASRSSVAPTTPDGSLSKLSSCRMRGMAARAAGFPNRTPWVGRRGEEGRGCAHGGDW